MTQWNLYPALNHLLLPHHCQALYEHQAPSPSMNLQTSGLGVDQVSDFIVWALSRK